MTLLLIQDVADRLALSPVTIAHWAYRRKPAPPGFPAPIKIGSRLRWRPEAIDAWLDSLQKTAQAAEPVLQSTAQPRRRGRPRKCAQQGDAA
jgi:predicted DNA-binding transcriptional regulator AlpA